MSNRKLRVGVLFSGPVQTLDMSPIDLFGMLGRDYLQACDLPKPLLDLGLDVECLYIASAKHHPFISCTADCRIKMTHTLDSSDCAPGTLDVLMVPGPDPNATHDKDVLDFLRGHFDAHRTDILVICTGAFVAASSGIYDGKTASGPRALLPKLKKDFPKVQWTDKRWEVDGNIWSSGGITNGLNMAGVYIRRRYPGPLGSAVCAMADVEDRGREYRNSTVVESGWWVIQIFRAWLFGKKA
ncbi:PfpI endopeptidase-like protein [Pseudovirgaria hyperparasitica]|uniref:PfpI endopeptidase-like protein n=1 Tax=Pseudovirgaria hyperparasitica TaxID=470096 RepID=A0A6A6WC83_9PEZI|nr:PfpI endopeptidase-like protein [Pseudovirgaria hyperparasitica]KAF2759570.1 PfpI endopeptidase-like protein [Pseudovirgaria hyperparasitica]